MKIYLLNPPYLPHYCRSVRGVGESSRGGTLYYPIWLSYCAAILDEKYTVRLIDAQANKWRTEDVISDIISFNPDIIIIDTNFSSIDYDISTAEKIKAKFSSIIVLVGPPISQNYEKIIKYNFIDIVIPFEYDFAVRDLVCALENNMELSNIDGIIYKTNSDIVITKKREFSTSADLDTIPFVSKIYKKHLNVNNYFLSSSLFPMVQIFTGRGCPNKCTFCSWPITLMGRKYRTRNVDNVLDELEWIQKNLKIHEVFFEDDTFTINKKRILDFCKKYHERHLNIVWSCNARTNSIDLEMMKAMKKANCRLLVVGFESGCNEILSNIQKGITVEQSMVFSQNAKKAGLLVHGDIIVGLPGETLETIERTKQFINKVRPELLQVLIPQPIPGTEMYKYFNENNYLLYKNPTDFLDVNGYQIPVTINPIFSSLKLNDMANSMLKEYYISPKYLPLALRQIFRKNGILELRRLIYSFKMFIKFSFRSVK